MAPMTLSCAGCSKPLCLGLEPIDNDWPKWVRIPSSDELPLPHIGVITGDLEDSGCQSCGYDGTEYPTVCSAGFLVCCSEECMHAPSTLTKLLSLLDCETLIIRLFESKFFPYHARRLGVPRFLGESTMAVGYAEEYTVPKLLKVFGLTLAVKNDS